MRRGGWWDFASLAFFAPWRETGFLMSKTTEQSENVYENKGSSMLKMRFLLAIAVFTPLTLGAFLAPRPVVRFAGYLGGRQKDSPNAIALVALWILPGVRESMALQLTGAETSTSPRRSTSPLFPEHPAPWRPTPQATPKCFSSSSLSLNTNGRRPWKARLRMSKVSALQASPSHGEINRPLRPCQGKVEMS